MVCARYLAEKFGLAGANEFENAVIASIVDAIGDVMQEMFKFFYEKDETRKKELAKKLKEFLPTKFSLFEKRAAGNENGWIFGNKLTWADLLFYLVSGWVIMGGKKKISRSTKALCISGGSSKHCQVDQGATTNQPLVRNNTEQQQQQQQLLLNLH